ncbi:MAG: site-specific integrase [Nitrospirae bacterium]|nr:site-specific integrase [Nitrospirota bacterium]
MPQNNVAKDDLKDRFDLAYHLIDKAESEGKMKGSIRAKGKCPNCEKAFSHLKRLGFICADCKTTPSRFYVDIFWKGQRVRVFCDKTGQPLDTYQRALNLQATIQHEIENFTFDISRYSKAELQKYWASTLLDQFLEAKLKTVAPSYMRAYKILVTSHKNFFTNMDVRNIKKLDIVNYIEHLRCRDISNKTIKNHIDNFKTFLTWLKTDIEILQLIPHFPKVETEEYNWTWLNTEEQRKVMILIEEDDRPIIRFLMLYGCRPGEARALKFKHVDIKHGTITVNSTFSGKIIHDRRKGRGAKPLMLPIHPELLDYLSTRSANALPEAFVFINPRTSGYYSMDALRKVWDRARKKGGLPKSLRLYDATRHSVGSQLAKQNVSTYFVSKALGHSNTNMTEKYMHSNLDDMQSVFEKLTLEDKIIGFKMKTETVTKTSPE